MTSGNISIVGIDNDFSEGAGLADLAAEGVILNPQPSSHVSLAGGAVRCVGFENTNGATGTHYCWDSRLAEGQQVVAVAGATFWNAILWTWADRYLLTIGWDD